MIRAKCFKALNLLKYISLPVTGCNRKVLLPIYQLLIRSILDYPAPIYGMLSPLIFRSPRSRSKFGDAFLNGGLSRKPCTQSLCRFWLTTTPLSTPHAYHYSPRISRATSKHPVHEYLFEALCNKPTYQGAYAHLRTYLDQSLSQVIKFKSMTPTFPPLPPWFIPFPKILQLESSSWKNPPTPPFT